jgi:hypothetical protein
MNDFGVIVTCCSGDYMFAKGCCASIRYFMGNVPLCLLIDGEFPLDGLPERYNAQTIKKEDVKDPFLQQRSYGWGTTKMIAYWEGPFKYFLLIDADTVVWGDMRQLAVYDRYDVILHQHDPWSEPLVSRWFFKVDDMKVHFPTFNAMAHGYANAGVMFVKRGIFDLREYQEVLDFVDAHPGMFFSGDQGFHNFMLFRAHAEGRIRVGNASIQHIVPDYAIKETAAKFRIEGGKPAVNGEPTVIHWAGLKPFVKPQVPMYSEPMTFFRKKFLKDTTDKSPKEIDWILSKEDDRRKRAIRWGKFHYTARSTLKRLLGR